MASIVVFVVFVVLRCVNIFTYREHTIFIVAYNELLRVLKKDKLNEVSKVIDYLEVRLPHHVTSYFW
jgi:hypothetical protein